MGFGVLAGRWHFDTRMATLAPVNGHPEFNTICSPNNWRDTGLPPPPPEHLEVTSVLKSSLRRGSHRPSFYIYHARILALYTWVAIRGLILCHYTWYLQWKVHTKSSTSHSENFRCLVGYSEALKPPLAHIHGLWRLFSVLCILRMPLTCQLVCASVQKINGS